MQLASASRRSQTDAKAAQAGTLLRGQPYLSELAWERGHRHGHQAYSLVGMIHTLAPPKVRELIGEVLLAPVQPGMPLSAPHPLCVSAWRACWIAGRSTSVNVSVEPARRGPSCPSCRWVSTRRLCSSSEPISAPVISCVVICALAEDDVLGALAGALVVF